ncbi:hypothetical protein J6590_084669 [Homalodisca vitripennis]|nr:hypothetical protein J6590_084669 [Homalodisca vitripennis]
MGLDRELTDSATSNAGVCTPGARLLDIIKLNQSSPGPGPRCESAKSGGDWPTVLHEARSTSENEGQAATGLDDWRDLSRQLVHLAVPTITSSTTISQEPAAVTPQNQHFGKLQHISYAKAVRKCPVLDSGDKSGSAAAVPEGVTDGQAAPVSPGVENIVGAKEASEHTSSTMRQNDSQSTF